MGCIVNNYIESSRPHNFRERVNSVHGTTRNFLSEVANMEEKKVFMIMLVLLGLFFILLALFGESFRFIPSFKTSPKTGVSQKNVPEKILWASKEELDQEVLTPDQLYENIESNKAAWDEFNRATDYKHNDAVFQNLRYIWTHNACAIDGSKFSSNETAEILQGHTPDVEPGRQYQNILGQSEAIKMIYAAVKDKTPISKHFLDTLNKMLVGHVKAVPVSLPGGGSIYMEPVAGDYRKQPMVLKQNDGTLRSCPNPDQLEAAMDALIDFCNNPPPGAHPVAVAVSAHAMFRVIYPYDQANTRQAHLLMGHLLMKEGLPPAILFEHQWKEYLETEHLANTKDPSIMIHYLAAQVNEVQRIMLSSVKDLSDQKNETNVHSKEEFVVKP